VVNVLVSDHICVDTTIYFSYTAECWYMLGKKQASKYSNREPHRTMYYVKLFEAAETKRVK